MLGGTNNQVINSIIHEVNYSGAGGNAITVSGDGHIIRNNTLYNAGRNIILHGGGHSGYRRAGASSTTTCTTRDCWSQTTALPTVTAHNLPADHHPHHLFRRRLVTNDGTDVVAVAQR